MAYAENREWSDQFIPTIKQIVGPYLLEPAPFALDVSEATDLIVFQARDMRIAARVRRNEYANKFPWQFTIRSRVASGAKTEFAKIVEGWGDWLFYGFAYDGDGGIQRWMLVDLHALRAALILRTKGCPRHDEVPNGDGTYFRWFDVRSFPATHPILVASSHELPATVLA
jgi:hypothetical protein